MGNAGKNVATLATFQALLLTNNTTAIAINGLDGFSLSTGKVWAVFPATGLMAGGIVVSPSYPRLGTLQ
jgi:hypothetical protein